MKNLIIFSFILFSAETGLAQSTSHVAMGQEFNGLVKMGTGGSTAFQSYSSDQTDGSQFFLPDWQNGEVITNNKEVFSKGFKFVYDKVRQELFIKHADNPEILLGNKEDIKSFTLKDADRKYNFVNSVIYGNIKPEVFYQLLVDNPSNDSSKISLLKFINTKLVKADKTDITKSREGIVNDAFVDNYTYFVEKGTGELKPLQLKTKAVKKVFSELNIDVEKYLKDNPGSINEEYMITMVEHLNN